MLVYNMACKMARQELHHVRKYDFRNWKRGIRPMCYDQIFSIHLAVKGNVEFAAEIPS